MAARHRLPPHSPGRVVIVRNPRARHAAAADELRAAARPLTDAGWSVEIADTSHAGAARVLAREAAAGGADVVVACGGDGTVNEVANGLAGSAAALAVVAGGTANVWAREAFVPRDAQRALALVANGRRIRIDLGEAAIGAAEPRRFLLMCGVGLDAAVVGAVERRPRLKRALGRWAFLAAGSAFVTGLHPTAVSITWNGTTVERALLLAVAGNTRLYGGMARLTDGARIDDGLLDLVTFADHRPDGRLRALRYASLAGMAARGGLSTRATAGVDYVRASEITLAPARSLPVQVDGEAIGAAGPDAPLRLRALPQALTAIVAWQPNPLLGEI